jgi:hypothetical protein
MNITILNIIDRLIFYLKHDISDIGFCLSFHVGPTEDGEIKLEIKENMKLSLEYR